MSKPFLSNFFIVGAPKAGSTSLYCYLDQHPQIYMSPIKEPCFFATEIKPDKFSDAFREPEEKDLRALQDYLVSVAKPRGSQQNSPPQMRRGRGAQRHGGGVIAVIPLLAPFLSSARTTPAAACGRSFPLSKEGIFSAEFRDRNYLDGPMSDRRFGALVLKREQSLKLFRNVRAERAIGEASVCDLWSAEAARNI